MNERSQQIAVGMASTPTIPPPFSVEVEEQIFKRLSDLATKENIAVNQLASEMLKAMLVLHHRELRQIIETIKKRTRRG